MRILRAAALSAIVILAFVVAKSDIFAQPVPEAAGFNFSLPFVPNEGRHDSRVKFSTQLFCGDFFITEDELTYCVIGDKNKASVIRESFLDIKGEVISFSPAPLEEARAKVSYFIGDDPEKWQAGTSTYKTVSLGNVYPGIKIELKADTKNVEKIFYISPGSTPEDIRIQVEDAKRIEISPEGNLVVKTKHGPLSFKKPIAYQNIQGEKHDIKAAYHKISRCVYGFQLLDDYNPNYPLIIDPALVYSTYLGGAGSDKAKGIAVDSSGNTYVTGETRSANFPPRVGQPRGEADVFITKLNLSASGNASLVYTIYYGGSKWERGSDIIIDSSENIYVVGSTESTGLPGTNDGYDTHLGGQYDAFFVKFDTSQNITYATYLGGRDGSGVAADSSGNAYVICKAGDSSGDGVTITEEIAYDKTLNGGFDVFFAKIDPSLTGMDSLIYSTCLGGAGDDIPNDIAVDSSGNAYITGSTSSTDFPTKAAYDTSHNGSMDVFVAKLDASASKEGSLIYSTYVGGNTADRGHGVAVDFMGDAYVTGVTTSINFRFPAGYAYDTSYNGGNDVFVAKLDLSVTGEDSLLRSTFLGGSGYGHGSGIAVDSSLNIYVTGETISTNFPTTENAYDTSHNGHYDAFVTKLEKDPFLRAYDGTDIIWIDTEPEDTVTSPLRVYKDGKTHGVELVNTDDPDATNIRVKTRSGIKALKRF